MNNDKANVVFKFIRYPEYIKPGARLLFREGRTKGMGRVTEIEPYDPRANLNRWQSIKNRPKTVENGQKVAGGIKLNKRGRSAVVRRTSRKISFSPRKVTTNTSVNNKKNQKKNPPFNPEENIIKEEEKIVQNGVQPVDTPQILNGAKTVQNGAQPAETPRILNGTYVETPRILNGAKIVQNGDHPTENPKILIGAQTSRIQNGAKIVQNGNHPIEIPQILNGAPVETPQTLNGATFETPPKLRIEGGVSETPPHTNPEEEVEEGSSAGKFVKIFFSKLKLFFQFLFFCALLFILFDEFLKPTLSELFWGFLGDEFYQTLIFPTPPSLQLLH